MKQIFKDLVDQSQSYTELRYHKRTSNSLMVQKGRVDVASQKKVSGVGVRTLVDGSWGFAATADVSEAGIKKSISEAQRNASLLAKARGKRDVKLADANLATEDYIGPGVEDVESMAVSDKLSAVVEHERNLKNASSLIHTARCS